jgi:transposase
MGEVSTVGLDIAKSVFQVHGVDVDGAVVIRKRVSRAKVLEFFAALPPCLIGVEACPTAHHWSRKLQALGHTVRLMPPSYVKAYVKRSKNDANDAAAICEAVTRPSMRFVPTKSEQQQSSLMLYIAAASFWSVSARCCQMRSVGTWPSSASSRRRAATARLNCSRLLPTRMIIASQRSRD